MQEICGGGGRGEADFNLPNEQCSCKRRREERGVHSPRKNFKCRSILANAIFRVLRMKFFLLMHFCRRNEVLRTSNLRGLDVGFIPPLSKELPYMAKNDDYNDEYLCRDFFVGFNFWSRLSFQISEFRVH